MQHKPELRQVCEKGTDTLQGVTVQESTVFSTEHWGAPIFMYIHKQDDHDNEYGSEGGVVWLNGFQSLETLFQVVSREPRL